VEAGASADLVAYRDDPRADPAALRRPELVLLRGRPFHAP
jgi:imidazolonepropionase-like amidohydrolase